MHEPPREKRDTHIQQGGEEKERVGIKERKKRKKSRTARSKVSILLLFETHEISCFMLQMILALHLDCRPSDY